MEDWNNTKEKWFNRLSELGDTYSPPTKGRKIINFYTDASLNDLEKWNIKYEKQLKTVEIEDNLFKIKIKKVTSNQIDWVVFFKETYPVHKKFLNSVCEKNNIKFTEKGIYNNKVLINLIDFEKITKISINNIKSNNIPSTIEEFEKELEQKKEFEINQSINKEMQELTCKVRKTFKSQPKQQWVHERMKEEYADEIDTIYEQYNRCTPPKWQNNSLIY